jgi:hypothetical protein
MFRQSGTLRRAERLVKVSSSFEDFKQREAANERAEKKVERARQAMIEESARVLRKEMAAHYAAKFEEAISLYGGYDGLLAARQQRHEEAALLQRKRLELMEARMAKRIAMEKEEEEKIISICDALGAKDLEEARKIRGQQRAQQQERKQARAAKAQFDLVKRAERARMWEEGRKKPGVQTWSQDLFQQFLGIVNRGSGILNPRAKDSHGCISGGALAELNPGPYSYITISGINYLFLGKGDQFIMDDESSSENIKFGSEVDLSLHKNAELLAEFCKLYSDEIQNASAQGLKLYRIRPEGRQALELYGTNGSQPGIIPTKVVDSNQASTTTTTTTQSSPSSPITEKKPVIDSGDISRLAEVGEKRATYASMLSSRSRSLSPTAKAAGEGQNPTPLNPVSLGFINIGDQKLFIVETINAINYSRGTVDIINDLESWKKAPGKPERMEIEDFKTLCNMVRKGDLKFVIVNDEERFINENAILRTCFKVLKTPKLLTPNIQPSTSISLKGKISHKKDKGKATKSTPETSDDEGYAELEDNDFAFEDPEGFALPEDDVQSMKKEVEALKSLIHDMLEAKKEDIIVTKGALERTLKVNLGGPTKEKLEGPTKGKRVTKFLEEKASETVKPKVRKNTGPEVIPGFVNDDTIKCTVNIRPVGTCKTCWNTLNFVESSVLKKEKGAWRKMDSKKDIPETKVIKGTITLNTRDVITVVSDIEKRNQQELVERLEKCAPEKPESVGCVTGPSPINIDEDGLGWATHQRHIERAANAAKSCGEENRGTKTFMLFLDDKPENHFFEIFVPKQKKIKEADGNSPAVYAGVQLETVVERLTKCITCGCLGFNSIQKALEWSLPVKECSLSRLDIPSNKGIIKYNHVVLGTPNTSYALSGEELDGLEWVSGKSIVIDDRQSKKTLMAHEGLYPSASQHQWMEINFAIVLIHFLGSQFTHIDKTKFKSFYKGWVAYSDGTDTAISNQKDMDRLVKYCKDQRIRILKKDTSLPHGEKLKKLVTNDKGNFAKWFIEGYENCLDVNDFCNKVLAEAITSVNANNAIPSTKEKLAHKLGIKPHSEVTDTKKDDIKVKKAITEMLQKHVRVPTSGTDPDRELSKQELELYGKKWVIFYGLNREAMLCLEKFKDTWFQEDTTVHRSVLDAIFRSELNGKIDQGKILQAANGLSLETGLTSIHSSHYIGWPILKQYASSYLKRKGTETWGVKITALGKKWNEQEIAQVSTKDNRGGIKGNNRRQDGPGGQNKPRGPRGDQNNKANEGNQNAGRGQREQLYPGRVCNNDGRCWSNNCRFNHNLQNRPIGRGMVSAVYQEWYRTHQTRPQIPAQTEELMAIHRSHGGHANVQPRQDGANPQAPNQPQQQQQPIRPQQPNVPQNTGLIPCIYGTGCNNPWGCGYYHTPLFLRGFGQGNNQGPAQQPVAQVPIVQPKTNPVFINGTWFDLQPRAGAPGG